MVKAGVATPLDAVPLPDLKSKRPTGRITLCPYRAQETWTLSLTLEQDRLVAAVTDPDGVEQARLSARNAEFTKGSAG